MSFLAKSFATNGARKRFLSGVSTNVHRHRVLILESLVANEAMVQRPLLTYTDRTAIRVTGDGVSDCGAATAAVYAAAATLLFDVDQTTVLLTFANITNAFVARVAIAGPVAGAGALVMAAVTDDGTITAATAAAAADGAVRRAHGEVGGAAGHAAHAVAAVAGAGCTAEGAVIWFLGSMGG